MRNLKLVRDVECLERGMKEYNSDTGPLQRQKVLHMHTHARTHTLTCIMSFVSFFYSRVTVINLNPCLFLRLIHDNI